MATYVHRAGRTGRAGAAGTAITLASPAEAAALAALDAALAARSGTRDADVAVDDVAVDDVDNADVAVRGIPGDGVKDGLAHRDLLADGAEDIVTVMVTSGRT